MVVRCQGDERAATVRIATEAAAWTSRLCEVRWSRARSVRIRCRRCYGPRVSPVAAVAVVVKEVRRELEAVETVVLAASEGEMRARLVRLVERWCS